jgi:hypothetical protein
MKTHTPGPWHIVPDPQWEGKHPNHSHRFICNVPSFAEVYPPTEGEDDGWQVFHEVGGRTICHMTDTTEIEANARLIASAPELLSSLEAVTKAYVELVQSDYPPSWSAEKYSEVVAARAAIAKAKGNA